MLGTILKRALVWSLPLAVAYLLILSVYGPHGKPWLVLAALLIPLFAVVFEATMIWEASLERQGGKQDARTAEVIGCWSGIAVCFVVFLIAWPAFHGGAISALIAVGAIGRRLLMPRGRISTTRIRRDETT